MGRFGLLVWSFLPRPVVCPISTQLASDGNFYGTTIIGGVNNIGTIFRLSLGLPPPTPR